MAQRPYFRLGVSLIVIGVALVALNIWLLFTFHGALPGSSKGAGAIAVIGAIMVVVGIMMLMGI